MTQEDRKLLLQDLSARMPYGVKIKLGDYVYQVCGYNSEKPLPLNIWYYYGNSSKSLIDVYLEDYHPYLRPLSSMTEEEENEFKKIFELELKAIESPGGHTIESAASSVFAIDFYNKYHFDYRGLIEKGLAIEVTEENNPYKVGIIPPKHKHLYLGKIIQWET